MTKIIKNHNVIIFFELSKILIRNTKNFKIKFINFLKKQNLKFYDLNLKDRNIILELKELENLKKNQETLGDFILSNFNFK